MTVTMGNRYLCAPLQLEIAEAPVMFTKISIDNTRTTLLQPGEDGGGGAVEHHSEGVSWQNWEAMQREVAQSAAA